MPARHDLPTDRLGDGGSSFARLAASQGLLPAASEPTTGPHGTTIVALRCTTSRRSSAPTSAR